MAFKFGIKSRLLLSQVHPDLRKVAERALSISKNDMTILEGMRTKKRQEQLVKSGASRTMNSRHLTGHAIDIGAYVGGQVRWDGPLYLEQAKAIRRAAIELKIPIRWGGVWDRTLNDLSEDLEEEVRLYSRRQKSKGKQAFIDMPHFELPRSVYP